MTEDILLPIISPYVHKNMNKISVRSRKTAPLRERADFRGSLTAELGPWPPFFSPFSGVFSSPLEHISTRKKLLHRPWSKGTSLTLLFQALNVLLVAFSSDNGSPMNLLVNLIELSQRMPAHPRFVYVLYLKVYLQPVEPFSFLQNLFSISFRAVLGGGLIISCLSFFYFQLKRGIIWVCGWSHYLPLESRLEFGFYHI